MSLSRFFRSEQWQIFLSLDQLFPCTNSQVRDETNLASSSIAESGDANDLLGVIVSYSAKVKIILSGMGGELEVDLPFKLVHPRPGKNIGISK